MDAYSGELGFSNIFTGNGRPESHEVKIQYSKVGLVQSELLRSDRRVASRQMMCRYFFYLKSKMQAVNTPAECGSL
jgi:hypothetical protein